MKHLHKSIASVAVATATATVFCAWSSSAEATSLTGGTSQPFRPLLTTAGNPDDYIVQSGIDDYLSGVVQLRIDSNEGRFRCSGSLLSSGLHILTAAHCLTDDLGSLIANGATVFFDLPTGQVTLDAAKFFVNPEWGGFGDSASFDGDIAIIELASAAPLAAERYDIYRDRDEIGKIGTKVGYGRSGNGNDGDTVRGGVKRVGQNRYDAPGEVLSSLPGSAKIVPNSTLAYDFDNGQPENDAFGNFFGIHDLGLGLKEVNAVPGDSGGATFIDGLIAGVTSFGFCPSSSLDDFTCIGGSDLDGVLNSGFGEFGADARVSTYASWIDSITGNPKKVPEPGTVSALLLTSLAVLLNRKKLKGEH